METIIGLPIIIIIGLLFVLGILLPVSAYSAQKYAYRCYKELVKLNKCLKERGI